MEIPAVERQRHRDGGHRRQIVEARHRLGESVGQSSAHDGLRVAHIDHPDRSAEKLRHSPIGPDSGGDVLRHDCRSQTQYLAGGQIDRPGLRAVGQYDPAQPGEKAHLAVAAP